jgi:hypothetical protein
LASPTREIFDASARLFLSLDCHERPIPAGRHRVEQPFAMSEIGGCPPARSLRADPGDLVLPAAVPFVALDRASC